MTLEEALLLDTLRCRFKYLREDQKLTPQEVSLHTAIPFSRYLEYEAGNLLPELISLLQIASFYNVSTDYLLGQTETPDRH